MYRTIITGINPKGIVLFAPFSSIQSVLLDYQVFGFLPVLQPLQVFPFLTSEHAIIHKSETYGK
jgi:abhydrolase domain-containing protein 12